MATQTHLAHHIRADALAGLSVLGATVLLAGTVATVLVAQGGWTIGAPEIAPAPVRPIVMTPTSVERARIVAVQPIVMMPTSVERARAAVTPIVMTSTSVERARIAGGTTGPVGTDSGSRPERRGGH